MDIRNRLQAGTRLSFPGMDCTVDSLVGAGSNAIVYRGRYADQQSPELEHHVLIKELFPYHPDGLIYRDADGALRWDADATETMTLQRESFQRGNEIHLRLLQAVPGEIEGNLNTFSLNNTLYSILAFSGGRSLDKELTAPGAGSVPLKQHLRRVLGALDVLESFHRAGYLHLDVSPDNILLIGDGRKERVTLIDYNSVHTLQELQDGSALYYSAKEGYTAPELRAGTRFRIGPAADLYSLTAVLYRCVAGRTLTILETSQAGAPDCSQASCVKELPETAISMLRHIFRRGLSSAPGRRYQCAEELRRDLEELQDRIDGKGITHWALWEAGKAKTAQIVRANPALYYVRDTEKLYPIHCVDESGASHSFFDHIRRMTAPDGCSAMLIGGGGVGKTTALLAAALAQPPVYSASEPAVSYVSLYGWNNSGGCYIQDGLLQSMRFKPETDSLDIARYELRQLLSSPAHTKWGERPRLLLLLDGLNEANGSLEPLLGEIQELAELPGVRLCVSSRSELALPSLQRLTLSPLQEEEVKQLLADNGLLPPEDPAMRQLLQTPLLLSLFIKTASEGAQQLYVRTREELLDAYFATLAEKSALNRAKDAPECWQTEAALYYVLPDLSKKISGTAAASDKALFPIVESEWKTLSSRRMRRVFPQWIGHISAIRADAKDAEAWYGQVVHGLLWRRLGLLVRDQDGNYRLFHSLIEDYLLARRAAFTRRFARYRAVRAGALAAAALFISAVSYQGLYRPLAGALQASAPQVQTYDVGKADAVISHGFNALVTAANAAENTKQLLDTLRQEPVDETAYRYYLSRCEQQFSLAGGIRTERLMAYVDDLLTTGEVMPWSGEALDVESYRTLITLASGCAERYGSCIATVEAIRQDAALWQDHGSAYLDELSLALDADLGVLRKLLENLIEPEFTAMGKSEQLKYQVSYDAAMDTLAMISPLALDTLQTYERIQFTAWNAVTADPVNYFIQTESQGANP